MLIGAAPLHVELPSVEIKLEGTAPSPAEKYKILLKAEGSLTSPMPSGSTDEGMFSPSREAERKSSLCFLLKAPVFILIPFLKSRAATVNAVMMKRCTP